MTNYRDEAQEGVHTQLIFGMSVFNVLVTCHIHDTDNPVNYEINKPP